MDLQPLYSIAAKDQSHGHSLTILLSVYGPDMRLWTQHMRPFLSALTGSYPVAFGALYIRLSGEERETLRLVHESLHAPESPRRLLYQELGVEPVPIHDDTLPAFIRTWRAWWQASASVKPLPEALGAFAIAYPAIETALLGKIRHQPDLLRAFLHETEKQRTHWEAVLQPYTARLDLIAQGTRQALRQWQTVQDQLMLFLASQDTTNE